jgi:glycerol-3-phosphate dehydrogenase (NAD(P)+)
VRGIASQLAQYVRSDRPLVICSKGFEQSTGKLLSEVVTEELPDASLAVLSGPSFASEIARGLPAAVTLAAPDEEQGAALSRALSHAPFRCYWSEDMAGAEIGGAVKNVYAIAAGIVMGKQARACMRRLSARGFAEMVRLGAMFGAKRETLTGLSGLGDLVLTCGSPQSRNMSLGLALGQGRSLAEALKRRQSVTEGIYTAQALAELAQSRGIEMPIASAVHAVVTERATVDEAIEALLSRPLRAET